MAFKKGQKAGPGRPKGMENKLTTEAREMFIQTLEGQVPNIQQAFYDVLAKSPEKYLGIGILCYIKYQSINILNQNKDE